jgi:hypothetical protein
MATDFTDHTDLWETPIGTLNKTAVANATAVLAEPLFCRGFADERISDPKADY